MADKNACRAAVRCQEAYEHFIVAHYTFQKDDAAHHYATGIKAFEKAAETLGFRLVPITTPQEDHEACLAKRVAEDAEIDCLESLGEP